VLDYPYNNLHDKSGDTPHFTPDLGHRVVTTTRLTTTMPDSVRVASSEYSILTHHQATMPKAQSRTKDVPDKEMYTIPIADRPPHGPLYSKIFFPILFNFGQIGINSAQILALPLLLIPVLGRKWFDEIIGWTKDGYGRLCAFPLSYLTSRGNHLWYEEWADG